MDRAATDAGAYVRARTALDTLSPREREVAIAVGRGHGNAEIAARLYLSVATVKAHISRIRTKPRMDNRTQIAPLTHDADLT